MIRKISQIILVILGFVMLSQPVNAADYDFDFGFTQDANGQIGITMDSPYNDANGRDILDNDVSRGAAWNKVLVKYKVLIVGFTGFVSLSLVGLGMFSMSKLSAVADNPQKKQEAIMHIGIILLAAMILGIGSLIFGYAYNVFR